MTGSKGLNKPAGLEVRLVALRLICGVIDKKISLDGLTDRTNGTPRYLALGDRDRALARAITLTTLRHYHIITALLQRFISRPLPRQASVLRHLIHLTVAQILYLEVPDHAAINLAVVIAKSDPRLRRFASLVNALARQVARHREDILENQNTSANIPASTTSWIHARLERDYGKAKAHSILKAQALPPPLDLTIKENAALWAEKLSGRLLPNGTVRLERFNQDLTQLPGFASGDWWVQDVAASLPARLFGDIRGKKVADLCAAPGGKTAQLLCLGAQVTAFDESKSRMQRLIENMQRLKLQPCETQICDVRDFSTAQMFDAVLCDAPCSSTGTIRRHPDILWTKSADDIARLVHLQAELLATALRFTATGGMVVFSNCSILPQEGEELIIDFLKKHPKARLDPISPKELPAAFTPLITPEGFLRSTPADLSDYGGMDGFFAARLRKL